MSINISWKRLLTAALFVGSTAGSATYMRAQQDELVVAPGGDYPNQCYYDCRGCGGGCLGSGYICCRQ
ncbi:MAG TPA: hypothetical protein VFY65_06105 [Longimicrobium sp.]|nr:hypothetical protein [Longimicrobium sp.]